MCRVRTCLAHVARAQHNQIRFSFAQRFIAETQTRYHPGPHVLNYDIGPIDQSVCQLQTFGVFQVECDAVLRIIEESETAGTIKSDLAVFEWWILQTKAVRPLPRFNVNYARAKIREVLADARSGGRITTPMRDSFNMFSR